MALPIRASRASHDFRAGLPAWMSEEGRCAKACVCERIPCADKDCAVTAYQTMTDKTPEHKPVEIKLHRKSRVLSIRFSDGNRFDLPCEYLRVFSKAAEVRTLGRPETGKEQVNIDRIEPQGTYALRLMFDDGHDTGIYSWTTLYELGINQEKNWNDYLNRLEERGDARDPEGQGGDESRQRRIRLLYFAYLVRKFGKASEELLLPDGVTDVKTLLAWLRKRHPDRARFLADDQIRVTVNKQFSEAFTRLHDADEVALVPAAPTPPAGV